jgi:hypothetical protein
MNLLLSRLIHVFMLIKPVNIYPYYIRRYYCFYGIVPQFVNKKGIWDKE